MGQNLQKVWVNQSHGVYGLKKEEGEKPEIQLLSRNSTLQIQLYFYQEIQLYKFNFTNSTLSRNSTLSKSEENQKLEEKP